VRSHPRRSKKAVKKRAVVPGDDAGTVELGDLLEIAASAEGGKAADDDADPDAAKAVTRLLKTVREGVAAEAGKAKRRANARFKEFSSLFENLNEQTQVATEQLKLVEVVISA